MKAEASGPATYCAGRSVQLYGGQRHGTFLSSNGVVQRRHIADMLAAGTE